MKRHYISLYNRKSVELFESSSVEPAIWLELRQDGQEQAYGLVNIEAARKLVNVLNTFIEENQ